MSLINKVVLEDILNKVISSENSGEICNNDAIRVKLTTDTKYYNIIFNNIHFTDMGLSDLLSGISYNIIAKLDFVNSYRSIIINEINGNKLDTDKSLKIQASYCHHLQLNCRNLSLEELNFIIEIIDNHFNKNIQDKLLANVYNLLVKQFSGADFTWSHNDESRWSINSPKGVKITYFANPQKGICYLNLQGIYIAEDYKEFSKELQSLNIFSSEIIEISSAYNIHNSDISHIITLKFFVENEWEEISINWNNSGFISLILSNLVDDLSNNVKALITYLLSKHIKTHQKITKPLPLKFALICELGFPSTYLASIIDDKLVSYGYDSNDIVTHNNVSYEAIIDKTEIFCNLSSNDDIYKLQKLYGDKLILIGCGLTRGLSSICKTRLIQGFNSRIKNSQDKLTQSQYEKISQELASLQGENESKLGEFEMSLNKCFHKADFFINYDSDQDVMLSCKKMHNSIGRFIDLLFNHKFITPTKDEFAMYMAFTAAMRSADLSRQVGAVITASSGDIIATGANDIPRAGGGLYYSEVDINNAIYDKPLGRDYMRGFDSNAVEKLKIFDNIYQVLKDKFKDGVDDSDIREHLLKSKNNVLNDITEYGRVVHAEMEALMACARNQSSTIGASLYCTTYPCHNCAKHIIAAGIKRVLYIEPYTKSKSLQFHFEAISKDAVNSIENKLMLEFYDSIEASGKVIFERFIGVGPRLFRDFFSRDSGDKKLKDKSGFALNNWQPQVINLLCK
ncbi:MAG: dCMP deaminase family protein [Burkholderiales bacterium]|nr:dCMP deaminase family protein [Burkholderiales bacterium]